MSSISFEKYNEASKQANENVNKNFGSVPALVKGMEDKQKNFDVENTHQGPSSP